MSDKYNTADKYFDSEKDILKNLLKITDSKELEITETQHLVKAYETLTDEFIDNRKIESADIQYIHKTFLGSIYEWAGKYRDVDISSADIRWCHAKFIPSQMDELDKLLLTHTPFTEKLTRKGVIQKLSEIHGELIIIHPFRDGNGRVTRLVCDLLLMQSGRLPIDRNLLESDEGKEKYFKAIKSIWNEKNYDLLISLFDQLISE